MARIKDKSVRDVVDASNIVEVVSLRTSLPITKRVAPPAEGATTIINNYAGPVFNAAVHGAQLAWNNINAIQQRTSEDGAQE